MTLGLAKLITEEFRIFSDLGIVEVWEMLFVTLLKNIQARSHNLKGSMRDNYNLMSREHEVQTSSDILQNRAMKEIKQLGDTSGFTRLQSLAPRVDEVLGQVKEMKESDMRLCIQKVREFLSTEGKNLNFNFLDDGLKNLIENFPT